MKGIILPCRNSQMFTNQQAVRFKKKIIFTIFTLNLQAVCQISLGLLMQSSHEIWSDFVRNSCREITMLEKTVSQKKNSKQLITP